MIFWVLNVQIENQIENKDNRFLMFKLRNNILGT